MHPLRFLALPLVLACSATDADGITDSDDLLREPFDPYRSIATADLPSVRGMRPYRGVIHVHTVHSWDACDERGYLNDLGFQDYDNGYRNEECHMQLRKALCDVRLDFAFLTDHNRHLPYFEYPEVLLYEPELGDELVEKNGHPAYNRIACHDGIAPVQASIGIDVSLLGVGFERHIADTPEERSELYAQSDQRLVDNVHARGGLGLAGYVPRWEEDVFFDVNFDGIEIYNPLYNLRNRAAETFGLVGEMTRDPQSVPVPELGLYVLFEEEEFTFERWAKRAQLKRTTSFLGSNAHRNVLPEPVWDGERIDSYRRNLHWFSNYALVPEGEVADIDAFEAAIAAGRSYGAFDAIGTPKGFDVYATVGEAVYEMGDEIPDRQATLHVTNPTVAGLGPDDEPPEVWSVILRAEPDGSWEEVGRGEGDFTFELSRPGAYRVVVHILPLHLVPFLGNDPDRFLKEAPWIYGNLIYVGMDYDALESLPAEALLDVPPETRPAPTAHQGCFSDHDHGHEEEGFFPLAR